ncbi:MAG: SAM hydrolase/SAM-dependent halogenase family protein [bacterium]
MRKAWLVLLLICIWPAGARAQSALVLQSDFGLKDGAVACMKGVAFGVDRNLKIFDLTHDIPNYNIWEAAYQLKQTASFWPPGTVFVSVVDPGVGTERKSVVIKTKTGHYFVSPDNGTLTLVAEDLGIAEVREIDEKTNRLAGSEKSYTFHGRDVYAYTAARLASGVILFERVGPMLAPEIVKIPYEKPRLDGKAVLGTIPILDVQYGNIWTNIDDQTFQKLGVKLNEKVSVEIQLEGKTMWQGQMPYVHTFGEVPLGQPLLYLNSLLNVSIALNQDSFAAKLQIGSGPQWRVKIEKVGS